MRRFLTTTLRTQKSESYIRTNKSGCIILASARFHADPLCTSQMNGKLSAHTRARLSAPSPPSFNMLISINHHRLPDNQAVCQDNEWVDPGHLATIFVRRIWASQIICTFKKLKCFLFTYAFPFRWRLYNNNNNNFNLYRAFQGAQGRFTRLGMGEGVRERAEEGRSRRRGEFRGAV